MFSHGRPADAAGDADLRAVDEPAAEVAEKPSKLILQRVRIPTPSECFAPGFQDGHLLDALLVQQAAELEVDLARREVVRVEGSDPVFDRRRTRRVRERLGQAARVVRDATLSYRCHTITSPSYGSYVSISRSTMARIAISSEARATTSSAS